MATARDFSYQNLNSRSFSGQDLTGANFTGARLLGTRFQGATLIQARFDGARAGSRPVVILVLAFLLVMVGLNVGITGLTSATVFRPEHVAHAGPAEGVLVYALLLVFMGSLFLHGPGLALLSTLLFIMIGWIGFLTAESIWLGGAAQVLYSDRHTLSIAIGTTGIAMWAGLLTNVFVGGGLLASLRSKCGPVESTTSRLLLHRWEVLLLLAVALGVLSGVLSMPGALAKGSAVIISLARVVSIIYIARQIVAEHSRFVWLQPLTRAAIAWGSTSFRDANLHQATFTTAYLQSADFLGATLSFTDFHRAQGLDFVRFGQTILRDRPVRHLLVTRRGQGQVLRGANVSFAQLTGADLTGADLTNANLTGADFTEVCLEHANLSQVGALGTCFESGLFTGACVEAWNIDSATRLEGIRCSHVYLLGDRQERRPSQGDFAPGEFARLFQEVLHTVDLIFRNGLDFSALLSAFKQVQHENPNTPLSIRSIENKGDGMVLVKVDAPAEVDKAQIHAELSEEYAAALKAVEARYQAELAAKDEQIDIYRQHQTALTELTQLLVPAKTPAVGKRVVLKVMEPVQLSTGFSGVGGCQVMLQIGLEGALPHVEVIGELPDFSAIAHHYSEWKQAYGQIVHCLDTRIQAPGSQITNISFQEILFPCQQAARQLKLAINQWLDSPRFRPLKEQLLEQLQPTDSIRVFWQTSDPLLRQLPLQMWRWFDRYSKAELIVTGATYRHQHSTGQSPNEIRILSVLGDRTGLDVTTDQSLLAALPDVSLTLLDAPSAQQVTDQLWDNPWDILFFAGHSQQADQKTQPGQIRLNAHDALSLEELRYGLRKATERGLKLAIFNTCEGLSLLQNLTDLPTPPLVVMRHPVPDQVAQVFLKNLLIAFSEGLPLHQAVREAREKLQGLESQFPFATWLPVICQSPASQPLSWQDLYVE
ncbi:MAG: pentapeptide repeat-containing protein [Cyanobacteria bacterium J06581_3]